MNRSRISSFDVARLAGVSRSAVSRAFTVGASVSDATREKVFLAAKQLGYHPNAIARTLTTQRSKIVAVVVADLENPFYAKAVSCMSSSLQVHGYTMLLLVAPTSESIDSLMPRLLSYQAEGIVVASATYSSAVTDYCFAAGLPLVLLNRYTAVEDACTVQSDNFAGGRMAADLLARSGHRRIGFVAGIEDTSSSIDRERGFVAGLAQHELKVQMRASGAYTYAGGMQAANAMLAASERPDAVFCANDLMAMAFIDAAMERNLSIPQDLSVIGYDNVPLASSAHYRLTTIDQNVDRMAAVAVDMLLAAVNGRVDELGKRTIACELVVRDSVRRSI